MPIWAQFTLTKMQETFKQKLKVRAKNLMNKKRSGILLPAGSSFFKKS